MNFRAVSKVMFQRFGGGTVDIDDLDLELQLHTSQRAVAVHGDGIVAAPAGGVVGFLSFLGLAAMVLH